MVVSSQTLVPAGQGEEIDWNRETFWRDGNVLYLFLKVVDEVLHSSLKAHRTENLIALH